MIVRRIDVDGDWTFGRGKGDYLVANSAVAQNVATRLRSFLGDCFFETGAGIDWFNLLGEKDQTSLNLAIAAVILNTQNVLKLQRLAVSLSTTRAITIQYQVLTSYSSVAAALQFSATSGI